MAETPAMEATVRTQSGTRDARALRAQGLIPCVIYGHGKGTLSVSLSQADLEHCVQHGQRLLEVSVGGKAENVLISDVQWDTFGQVVLHADLTRVDLDERVRVTVPIVLRGTPAGATEGGVLQQNSADVMIECAVRDIPEDIRIMVTGLNVGDVFLRRDLELPAGATLIGDEEARVCSVIIIEEEVEEAETDEEQAGQPEVIGEKAEDDEDDSESKGKGE